MMKLEFWNRQIFFTLLLVIIQLYSDLYVDNKLMFQIVCGKQLLIWVKIFRINYAQ